MVGTRVGQLDFWFRVEREAWGNHFDWGIDSTRQLLGLDPPLRGTISLNLFLITVVLAAGLLVLAAWQRLPWPELTYALVVLAPAYGTGGQGLRPRMLVAAFPLVIPLARWVRPANLPYVLVGSATLMGATAALSSVYDFTVP